MRFASRLDPAIPNITRENVRVAHHTPTSQLKTTSDREHLIGPLIGLPDLNRMVRRLMFQSLMLHPMLGKFAGPCPRCGKFYLAKSVRQKVYCSRKCGAAGNAVISTRKRREREHQEKLVKATLAIKAWKSTPARRDWKRWVSGETQLTPRFLSRALNKGALAPPEG
jgi:hypothetical protein